ncbi:MAG: secretin N-terminal domain-containing protein [Candidatus Zipacnadales bacterium]
MRLSRDYRVTHHLNNEVMIAIVALGVLLLSLVVSAQSPPGGSGGPPSGSVGGPPPAGGQPPPSQPSTQGETARSEEKKAGEGEKKAGTDQPIAVFIPQPPNGDKLISMSFDQADIDHVLKFLAEQSGKTIVKEPSVQTKVTIVSTAKITVADAFRVLAALLSVKGFSMIQDDDIVRVVPKKSALQEQMEVRVGEGEFARTDKYVTHIIQIEHIDATKLQQDLKPLMPDEQGVLISNADTNTLIAIGTEASVGRILDVVKALDTDRSEVQKIDVINLKYADAEELAQNLNELFQEDTGLAGLPPEVRARIQAAMNRGGGGPEGAAPITKEGGLIDLRGRVKIVAEQRTNSLFVAASEANLQTIKDIVAKVDVDMRPEIQAKIVPLQFADPETVAEQINQLYEDSSQFARRGGSIFSRMFGSSYSFGGYGRSTERTEGLAGNRVVPDLRTRSLIVTADEENMAQILDLVKQLDISAEIEDVVKAIPLENAVAGEVAETLNNLIQGQSRRGGFFFFALLGSSRSSGGEAPLDQLQEVNVVADEPTNTILLTGPPETFGTLERLIKQLDRRVPQVYIEVLIADVTLGKDDRLGIEWNLIDRNLLGHSSASGNLSTSWEGLANVANGLSYSIISNSIQSFLRTLEKRSDVKILSSPNIIASDNTPATISIGEQIPYQASVTETSGGSIQQQVDFVDVSNTLDVTPHINQRERISLEVTQTVDALISFDEKLLAPRIAKREASTTVEVRDGQTIIIGGIISEQRSLTIQGVPILRKIPVLGSLFEDKRKETKRTELLVFLTPHIIVEDAQVEALTEASKQKLSADPMENEDFRPIDIPRADMKNRGWTLDLGSSTSEPTPEEKPEEHPAAPVPTTP